MSFPFGSSCKKRITINAQDGKQDEGKEANTEYSSLSPSIFHYAQQDLIS